VYLDAEAAATWQQSMAEQAEFRYVAAADPCDVMHEQLDFLLDHAAADCPPGCPDCGRLAEIVRPLMRPFLRENE
jgi:hypothetical protein